MFIGIYNRFQVSVYRTIGPLVIHNRRSVHLVNKGLKAEDTISELITLSWSYFITIKTCDSYPFWKESDVHVTEVIHLVLFEFCLFELMLIIPVNSKGHVGMLPPFYRTFTQN